MPESLERPPSNPSSAGLLAWLTNLVGKLPTDARSSLRVEPLSLVGFTDERRSGNGNQDRIAVAYSVGESAASSWLLAVVCDGVGGSFHGERAASTAIAALVLEAAKRHPSREPVGALKEALHRAHSHTSATLHTKSSTTAVAVLITADAAALGWIGDSRAYEIADGKANLLTTDDTLAAATARANPTLSLELNEEYADRLSQAIGGNAPVTANVVALRPSLTGAMCLLCTDGIWKPTESAFNALVGACREGQELMRRLLLVSDWMGGHDNASAVLVPPLGVVRDFFIDSANVTPSDFVVLCLPGYSQTLIPVHTLKGSNASRIVSEQSLHGQPSVLPDQPVPPKKAPAKRRAGSAPKTSAKGDRKKLGAQLVIAEEPLDEASANTPIEIQSDEPPT